MVLITDGYKQYYVYGSMLENTRRSNSVTKYPTVEGTTFTDHLYREPDAASFSLSVSEISKAFIYEFYLAENGERIERHLNAAEVKALLERWFRGVHVTITTLRFNFENQILQSYSWSDQDLSLFKPALAFVEARVQRLRVGVVVNPDQYYQAAYGSDISVGNSVAAQSEPNLVDALGAMAAGAAVGALIGTVVPGIGTGVGAVIGGAIGFFGAIL